MSARPPRTAREHTARAALTALVLTGMATQAAGQTIDDNQPGFSVERFTPPPGPGVFLAAERADVLPPLELQLAMCGSLMARPLVLEDVFDRGEVSEPVRVRLGFDFLAAIGVGRRFQVGVAMPVVAAQDGARLQGIDLDETSLQPVALGDLRLHGKLRLVGFADAAGGGVAAAVTATLPTGAEGHFAGERGPVLEGRLIGSWRWRNLGTVAVNVGYRHRTEKVVLLSPARPHGDEVVGLFAGEVAVPGTAHLRGLVEYAFVTGDPGPAGKIRGPSPEEVRAGARWRFATGVTLTGGLGFGTSPSEVGSPAWRVIAQVAYETAPSSDLDRDGIADGRDRCRLRAEDPDGFEDTDGCPDLDNDRDGVLDSEDECPDQAEDRDGYHDLDGCPDAEYRIEPSSARSR